MGTAKILKLVEALPLFERLQMAEAILRSVLREKEFEKQEEEGMDSAAEDLLEDYQTDKELTIQKELSIPAIDKPLTNLQLEILKLFSLDLADEELLEIRRMLARYFAERASDEMDRLWEENKWTNETMDEWLRDENNEGSNERPI